MFQYALYRKLISLGKVVKADISWYSKNKRGTTKRTLDLLEFPIRIEECKSWEIWLKDNVITRKLGKSCKYLKTVITEETSGVFVPKVLDMKYTLLDGYWQTEKYFADIRNILLADFTFPKAVSEQEKRLTEQIEKVNSVSIHIRRGDYLYYSDKYGGICTEDYYKKAIQYIQQNIKNTVFYVFSDDMEWSRNFLKSYKDTIFVEYKNCSGIHDMKLMAKCKHNIIANSSFSWWASWLNQNEEKIIIAPVKWQNMNECPDIRCKNWISLPN